MHSNDWVTAAKEWGERTGNYMLIERCLWKHGLRLLTISILYGIPESFLSLMIGICFLYKNTGIQSGYLCSGQLFRSLRSYQRYLLEDTRVVLHWNNKCGYKSTLKLPFSQVEIESKPKSSNDSFLHRKYSPSRNCKTMAGCSTHNWGASLKSPPARRFYYKNSSVYP